MEKSVSKACSRCKKQIQCRADAIENCDCSKIKMSAESLEHLEKTNYDCLCNACLLEVDNLVQKADSMPTKAIEDVHYYLENGLLVFTELNHIQRGYCCQSDCRHCAYGYGINTK